MGRTKIKFWWKSANEHLSRGTRALFSSSLLIVSLNRLKIHYKNDIARECEIKLCGTCKQAFV